MIVLRQLTKSLILGGTSYVYTECIAAHQNQMTNLDATIGHKLLLSLVPERGDQQAIGLCYNVSVVENIQYFGVHNKECLVQYPNSFK